MSLTIELPADLNGRTPLSYGEFAQMVGARLFNERAGRATAPVFGCVTTGETWQFMRLAEQTALLHKLRYYLDNVGRILGVFQAIYQEAAGECLNVNLPR